MVYEDLTQEIIGCFYKVQNELGPGLVWFNSWATIHCMTLESRIHGNMYVRFGGR